MIDLSKVTDLLKATQGLAQLQQQANVSQQNQANAASGQAQAADPATSKLFAQLGAVIANANTQSPATQDPNRTALLRQAAVISSKTKALMAKADALEAMLNLAPTPESVDVGELFEDFKKIMEDLSKDMDALNKKAQERKDQNSMTLEQKPTAMKAGEHVGDLSFNKTLTV
ncbi:hypothetical protein COW36_23245 [bacterium (Candidatus Blackallbacteria) CG17_big_fil_post_rev_8_21_14_2_50_48_46]|uniref:Uncharacterized protein n=1 Tax=bacterium (Candidatus Blackallbacteria) CG17_big_fil_post_rev_8_21_14_2_50_48_46 TaxID=2014261 RepID=A0A2M7FY60_9BACT|nr:MAG: hypothetical protein COW64_17460 [bacterium (Candidatus Blackallbacteria) CG18_big_fil_WC_8_21_14_2_50_49_26]PIW13960.1 MAG: hypothetical protein COW36_23245 [bacterium (Candidatus Blackallbacteria) CG17_big_fil_post_rev_8_21_14_2_50_48_46]PIW46811.1 MAG: hypothetical protein COW20_14425 [bacterium (Candidatus Blackallbacteria) CG13_big_fil_rev_8_21_14_2_50_49_14]